MIILPNKRIKCASFWTSKYDHQDKHKPKWLVRHPGIEPGAPRWQRGILPLNQWRFQLITSLFLMIDVGWIQNGVRSGIRTHAPEETRA